MTGGWGAALAQRWFSNTVRTRLTIAMALLVAGVFAGSLFGVVALRLVSSEIATELAGLRDVSRLNAAVQSGVLNTIATAEAYLASPSAELRERFALVSAETHAQRRDYRQLRQLTPDERVLVDSAARLQAILEVQYSLAHALQDLGRMDEARATASRARGPAAQLTQAIGTLSDRAAERATESARGLRRSANRWQWLLLGVLAVSTFVGIGFAVLTLRAIQSPLDRLARAAGRLGEGDLRPVEHGAMAREFALLADAFSGMSDRLGGIVRNVVDESERIASSAGDLSAISEELAASSGEISTSMIEISGGAERQAAKLNEAGAAASGLQTIAGANAEAAERVARLGGEIHRVAARHQEDVRGTLHALLEVRGVVQTSAGQVAELARSSESINDFVALVKRIASQTNLLALNAAIEAARAGEHGRGFAVVAEEVRKLADESAAAAEQVTETLDFVRRQVEQVTRTMQAGVQKVEGVEAVSQGAARGLEEIIASVAGIEEAAKNVADAAARNRSAAQSIQTLAADASAQGTKHAASAQTVTAAAEQQSASTEEMAAAASEMLAAAERLRKVVTGFRL
jgi:methyl-accepting chemotaxis protein